MKQSYNEKAANVIIDHFADAIKPKCTMSGKKYDRLACVDDDVFSAFIAAWYYHAEAKIHKFYPKVDVIGGYGLMSGIINPKKKGKRLSEAEMLRYVLIRLGVRPQDIEIVCSKGTNTGQNLSGYAEDLVKIGAEKQEILFCLTKRLAGRFYLTQIKQQPQLKTSYVWLTPDWGEMQLYNGKGLAGGRPYFSEAASIYDRYLRYADPKPGRPQFMAMLDKALPQEVIEAGEYLCSKHRLKIPRFSLLKLGQFVLAYGDFLMHRGTCRRNLEDNIRHWQDQLQDAYVLRKDVMHDDLIGRNVPILIIK